MERDAFLQVTGVSPETFDQREPKEQMQLLAAVAHATQGAKNFKEAQALASKAVQTCCQNWENAMRIVARLVVPLGETNSVANLEYEHAELLKRLKFLDDKLSELKQKVGLAEPQAT